MLNQALSSTISVWPRSKSFISAMEARELIALTAPITGTALINMGMSITDTVMMGWSGPEGLAAGAVVSASILSPIISWLESCPPQQL